MDKLPLPLTDYDLRMFKKYGFRIEKMHLIGYGLIKRVVLPPRFTLEVWRSRNSSTGEGYKCYRYIIRRKKRCIASVIWQDSYYDPDISSYNWGSDVPDLTEFKRVK